MASKHFDSISEHGARVRHDVDRGPLSPERAAGDQLSATEGARTAESPAPLPLYTLPEVAQLLRVSPRTVRRLVARGRIPCVRVGAQVRFSPAILARWAERGGR